MARVRAKAFQWVAAARAKAPDAAYVRIAADALSEAALDEALSTQGLFVKKTLILLDDPFSEKRSAELVLESLDQLAESPNPVAILAPKLIPARAKKVGAKAEKVYEIEGKAVAGRGFNAGLGNALAARDGALLWKEVVLALRAGDAPEAVHGLLHWKARDLMKRGGGMWGQEGAGRLSRELIELLSDSRGRDLPLALALERFALSLGKQ